MPTAVAIFAVFHMGLVHMLPVPRKDIHETEALSYLQKFGYLPEPNPRASSMIHYNQFADALAEFQRFANLPATGLLDDATQRKMATPRCGVRDVARTEPVRRNRYKRSQPAQAATQGGRWEKREITWNISRGTKSTNDLPLEKLNEEFERAWKVWTDHIYLKVQRTDDPPVDINISFAENDLECSSGPFDGPGGAIAHAFYPRYGGDVHFDDSEHWLANETMHARYKGQRGHVSGTNLLYVAAHEFGHALGLEHSKENSKDSLMRPFYSQVLNVRLNAKDIGAVQALYGKPIRDICENAKIDAITTTADGKAYAFRKNLYYQLAKGGVEEGYPRRIVDDWYNLPDNLDAAFTWTDGRTFFFKGDKYWKFENMVPERGYPRLISEGFPLIPDGVSAAFTWNGNNHTYFIKGGQYWRYQHTIDVHHSRDGATVIPGLYRYPRSLVYWGGVPTQIDAVLPWSDGHTYFFSGAKYYRLNDSALHVEGTPGWTAVDWFGCDSESVGQIDAGEPDNRAVNMAFEAPKYVPTEWVVVSGDNNVPGRSDTVSRLQRDGISDSLIYHSSAAKMAVYYSFCAILCSTVLIFRFVS